MENYLFKHVTFSYPEQEKKALDDISCSINQGDFLVICGLSGSGKSTLLRHLKTCLTPHGLLSGEILYQGKILSEVEDRIQAQEIGFILQSPENQVVTDKVWHELAFGLESLGYDTPTIRCRVAEIASFFGIENWFYKNVNELSGGQKQLLNLASVLAMQPKILILDEPTSQLDPIAASEFLSLLGKINRELGITVILSEHRLEESLPYATRVLVMENGRIICDDVPQKVGMLLKQNANGMFLAMPTAMRVWAGAETQLECPVTICEGSVFLSNYNLEKPLRTRLEDARIENEQEIVLKCEDVWFRYEKDGKDILKEFSIKLHKGECYAILGGNGVGKTTALKNILGILHSYRGSMQVNTQMGYLPQNPQTLFVKRSVREDLFEVLRYEKLSKSEKEEKVARIVKLCGLIELLDQHPYDISGGEQQRLALAKVLLTEPRILLMDEPTKGFDAAFKIEFATILKQLLSQGVAILMVSHDICFCAEYAHRCGMFFDGNIVAEGTPREFFSGNSFYTTPANRMSRHLISNAITVADIIECCGGQVEKCQAISEEVILLPEPNVRSVTYKPKPLPLWRKGIALLAGVIAFAVFWYAMGITDLSKIVDAHGLTSLGIEQIQLYVILFVSLFIFIAAIGRRSAPPIEIQTKKQHRKLNKRTVAAMISSLILIPLTIFAGVFYMNDRQYNVVAVLVLIECMLPFFLVFEGRNPKPRELVVIAVLCGLGVAGRSMFFMLPQFKPVMALTIIAGVAWGGETGFLVGAATMLFSNMFFSQGPWTPWQMFSMGIIGFLSGVLFKKGWLRRSRSSLAVFGAMAAILIYGGIMNPAAAVISSSQIPSWEMLLAYYITGLPMDLIHALGTVVFLMLGAEPMLEKMDRIKEKYGLI